MTLLSSFRFWCLALVLVVGSVIVTPSAPSTWQTRVAHLETLVKCPSCDNLSVAQSTAASSLAVRAQITAMVRAGDSDTQVFTAIERAYGPTVLLTPPEGGLTTVLWVAPLALLVVALAIVARLRRR
jgi:cytochrome c-type biogenesis protein CcmH